MSVAKDMSITFVGFTPNPVNVSSTFLAQAGVTEVNHTWSEYTSTSWNTMATKKWGTPV